MEIDDVVLQIHTDRTKFKRDGLQGRKPGTVIENILKRQGLPHLLPGKCQVSVSRGDVFAHTLAGVGGWGNRQPPDPNAIERDLLEGKITHDFASREFGAATTALVQQEQKAESR